MSDRLQELLRQRATIQAHLVWLDHEIAQARPTDATSNISSLKTQETTPVPAISTPLHDKANTPDADVILAGYRQDTQSLRTNLRKGCLIYFFGALALIGLAIVSFYFVNRLIQPFFPDPASEQHSTKPAER